MKEQEQSGAPDVLAIIPARGGSVGVPRKNIRLLDGRPLISYAIKAAHAARLVDATIISTDDTDIADVARAHGGDVPFMRPAELSGGSTRDVEYIRHALEWLAEHRSWHPTYVVLLLPTSPTRTAADIDVAIELLRSSGADAVRTVVGVGHFTPYKMWKDEGGGRMTPLFPEGGGAIPRQELPRVVLPVGIVYALRAENVRSGSLWGADVRMLEFPSGRYSDIDTEEDLVETERLLQDMKSKGFKL